MTVKNEDTAQRAARLTRDRILRMVGGDSSDPQYRSALFALRMMREEVRKLQK